MDPTGGTITANDNDGITVSREHNGDGRVIASAVIRWSAGDTQWPGEAAPPRARAPSGPSART